MRDHGGDLDRAIATYGGMRDEWIDLSTGINRVPYPVPSIAPSAWECLPTRAEMEALRKQAAQTYATPHHIAILAGAQHALQLLPYTRPKGHVRILGPTYNEYQAAFDYAGWRVEIVEKLTDLSGADVAIVVNPNNPDGRLSQPRDLLALRRNVSLLVVDESFTDPTPNHSLSGVEDIQNLLILRSFGKFYGLAGLRLGFAIGSEDQISRLQNMAGPWPVCGAALQIGRAALADDDWRRRMIGQLKSDAERLDQTVRRPCLGGTNLFRLYQVKDSESLQRQLAARRIWVRIFPWNQQIVRIGIPTGDDWSRLEDALSSLGDFGG